MRKQRNNNGNNDNNNNKDNYNNYNNNKYNNIDHRRNQSTIQYEGTNVRFEEKSKQFDISWMELVE